MSIDATLREAVSLHRGGRTAEALALYERVLAEVPEHPHALNFAGAAFAELGRVDEAVDALERATRADPGYPQAFANLGVAYRCAGRFDDAVRAQSRVVELAPQLAEGWNELGIGLRRLGRYERAEAAYRRALALRPQMAQAHANLGNVLQDLDRMEEAERSYREAIRLDARAASARRGLGNALQRQQRIAQAVQAYREALEIDPDYVAALVDLGGALVEIGEAEEGAHHLSRAARLAPEDPMVHSNLGTALHVLGRHAEALEAFDRALRLDPGNTHALSYKTITLHELGRHDDWHRLVGLRTLVRKMTLVGPAADALDVSALNARLSAFARSHPSVRGGRRPGISSELFLDGSGAPVELRELIAAAVRRYIAALPPADGHPFITRAPERFVLSGWCNVLTGGADSHVHPNAWLSGVYYARCQGVVGDGERDLAGCLEVGPPDAAMYSVEGYPRRVFVPEEGTLVVFPSYVWHRILPFEGRGERISYAFDVIAQR